MAKKYLRKKAVCERYGGITPRTLERAIAAGKIAAPEFPFQNRIPFWDEAELDRWDRAAVVAGRARRAAAVKPTDPTEANHPE